MRVSQTGKIVPSRWLVKDFARGGRCLRGVKSHRVARREARGEKYQGVPEQRPQGSGGGVGDGLGAAVAVAVGVRDGVGVRVGVGSRVGVVVNVAVAVGVAVAVRVAVGSRVGVGCGVAVGEGGGAGSPPRTPAAGVRASRRGVAVGVVTAAVAVERGASPWPTRGR